MGYDLPVNDSTRGHRCVPSHLNIVPYSCFPSFVVLGYSVISPIINGFACVIFFAFYQLYKFLFLWQYQQSPAVSDTGGLFFPRAIQHIFVGLYVQQVSLFLQFSFFDWLFNIFCQDLPLCTVLLSGEHTWQRKCPWTRSFDRCFDHLDCEYPLFLSTIIC